MSELYISLSLLESIILHNHFYVTKISFFIMSDGVWLNVLLQSSGFMLLLPYWVVLRRHFSSLRLPCTSLRLPCTYKCYKCICSGVGLVPQKKAQLEELWHKLCLFFVTLDFFNCSVRLERILIGSPCVLMFSPFFFFSWAELMFLRFSYSSCLSSSSWCSTYFSDCIHQF